MEAPTFRLDEDGKHVWIKHTCVNANGFTRTPDVMLPAGPHGWQVQNAEPLTVTPSILCDVCGLHGFITNGEWVE